jgi:hypothetical protein
VLFHCAQRLPDAALVGLSVVGAIAASATASAAGVVRPENVPSAGGYWLATGDGVVFPAAYDPSTRAKAVSTTPRWGGRSLDRPSLRLRLRRPAARR